MVGIHVYTLTRCQSQVPPVARELLFRLPLPISPRSRRTLRACFAVPCTPESFPDSPPAARVSAAESVLKRAMRSAIVEEGRRPDGRRVNETRDLAGEVRGRDVLRMCLLFSSCLGVVACC